MKGSGRLWLRSLIQKATETGGEFNTCAFPWLSHDDIRPRDLPFLVPSYPSTPKLHSDVYVLESSENKGSHSSFSYAVKQTPFSVNVQPIGRLVVWKYWSSKAPVMGLTLMGNPPTLPCPSLLYQSALWAPLIGHSIGIDELTLTNVVLYELADVTICHSSLLNCLQSIADLMFLCQVFPLRMKEDRTK